jgi:hypothetical protein
MNEDKNYYVYFILDTRKTKKFNYLGFAFDYEPFYVGKGKDYRYADHFQHSTLIKENNRKSTKIKSIINKTGKNPKVEFLYTNLTNEEALEIERNIIKDLKRDFEGGILTNTTEGGENPPAMIGEANGFFGKKHSEETKQIMRDAKLGKKLSAKTRRIMSQTRLGGDNGFFGKKHSEETKQIMRDAKLGKSRKIYKIVFDDGNEIIVNNMKKYCEENNYNYNFLVGLVRMRKRKVRNKYGISFVEFVSRVKINTT